MTFVAGAVLTADDLNTALAAAGGMRLIGTYSPSASSSYSINSIFSSAYSAYILEMELTAASGSPICSLRFRASGTDNSATEYDVSLIIDNPTTPASSLTTAQTSGAFTRVGTALSTTTLRVYRPASAEPTSWRSQYVYGIASPAQGMYAGGHEVSASYDGLTIIPASSSISGTIRVYALAQ